MYYLTVLEAGSPKSRCCRAMLPLKALREAASWLFLASYGSGHSLAHGGVTPISSFSVCLSPFLCLIKTIVTEFRTHVSNPR